MLPSLALWFSDVRCVVLMNRTGLEITVLLAAVLIFGPGYSPSHGVSPSQPSTQQSTSLKPAVNVRPLTDRKFERTPKRLARGRYLVNGIGECFACHGPSDPNLPGWPPVRGKEGSGFNDVSVENPGVVAANLTPDRETGIGNWTDDMLARAIREGVGHDGRLLRPTAMPYEFYRLMSDEDLASIVVYLRSIPPIRNALRPATASGEIVAPYAIPIYTSV